MDAGSSSVRVVAVSAMFLLAVSSASLPSVALTDNLSGQFHCLTGTLLGTNEVPPNASVAIGTIDITVDVTANDVLFTLTFVGLVSGATTAHIHQAPVGVGGAVKVPLPLGIAIGQTSGSTSGTATPISGFNVEDIVLNPTGFYVNVHNAVYPGGEIRGQIVSCASVPTSVPEFPLLGGFLGLVVLFLPLVLLFRRLYAGAREVRLSTSYPISSVR